MTIYRGMERNGEEAAATATVPSAAAEAAPRRKIALESTLMKSVLGIQQDRKEQLSKTAYMRCSIHALPLPCVWLTAIH
jgi:hypothetical protein|eukprot:COSAG06_NODE_580_length_14025_cov_11.644478_2_plen_79_part_00